MAKPMPHNRYYVEGQLEKDMVVTLAGDEAHHLVRVLRSRSGDVVELVNGRGILAKAQIESLSKSEAQLHIIACSEKQAGPPLIVAQALPRMNHLDWIIEKGTELNATAFWLFPGFWSEKETLSENQLARLRSLTISSMKQCGRLDLPEIIIKPPLLQWQPFEGSLFFGDTAENAPYLSRDLIARSSQTVIFIGPEKGLSPEETAFLSGTLGAKGIRLHRNILRAETASLVALVQLQHVV